MLTVSPAPFVAVVGGGPAGLMAAEVLSQNGRAVHLYDAMPTVGRKFLLAGKGGLNLTHSEPLAQFLDRYGDGRSHLEPLLRQFGPTELRAWAADLGITTFVGTSGRVFPAEMKAAPLLRAWLRRLRAAGVAFHVRHRWLGWTAEGALRFATPAGETAVTPQATIFALGGGSWARLGSDGVWVPLLQAQGVAVAPLRPANCGFDVGWSDPFQAKFAGAPVKTAVLTFTDTCGHTFTRQGEFVITATGVEGSLIYAAAARLRDEIAATGHATFHLDLLPDKTAGQIQASLAKPRGSRSLSSHLQSRLGLKGVKVGLLRECLPADSFTDLSRLAAGIKAVPVRLLAPRPLDEAISSAGGVTWAALDESLMLHARPGVFCAGEMLDWEAPTGGYLLTACFATGRAAGYGALRWRQGVVG